VTRALVAALVLVAACRHGAAPASADGSLDAAYKRKDWPAMLRVARREAAAQPDVPRALYNLACAEALNGHGDATAATIDRLAALGVFVDLAHDGDLSAVRTQPAVVAALGRLDRIRGRSVGHAEVALTLPGHEWLTEGVAWDPDTGDLFVSDVRRRQIVRVGKDGQVRPFVRPGQDGLGGILGMAVDRRRRSLWVTSSGLADYVADLPDAQRGKTAVYELDLPTGKLRERIELDAPGGKHHFDDLTLDDDGRVYLSDGEGGAIWSLEAGAPLDLWFPPGQLPSPQGMAWSSDGKSLYVADYARGLARIDGQSKALAWVHADGATLVGIDGLVRDPRDNALVATQNGIAPNRVVRLTLAGDRARVETLLMGDPRMTEPTLGAIVGDDFVFVANAQWEAFAPRKPGAPPAPEPAEPLLLRLSLHR
jgi:sugar lactone lactonase YvrE